MSDVTCPACKEEVEQGSRFCPECGNSLTDPDTDPDSSLKTNPLAVVPEDSAVGDSSPGQPAPAPEEHSPAAPATAEHPPTAAYDPRLAPPGAWVQPPPGYGPPPPGYGSPPPGYPVMYGYPPPPPSSSRGLIIGLATAGLVALGAIVVAVIVAIGAGGGDPPRLTEPVAATIPAVPPPPATDTTPPPPPPPATQKASKATPVTSPSRRKPALSRAANAAIQSVVQNHWHNVKLGNYASAYAAFGPGLRSDRKAWIREHIADDLDTVSLTLGRATSSSPGVATVPVRAMRTVADSGCFRWTGSYDMLRSGGSWLMNASRLTRSSC